MMQKKILSLLVAGGCGLMLSNAMAAGLGGDVSVNAGGMTTHHEVEVKTDGLQNSTARLQEHLNTKAEQADQGLNRALDAHAKADASIDAKTDAAKAHVQGTAAEDAMTDAHEKAKAKEEEGKEKANNASIKAKKWKKGQHDRAAKAAEKAKADASAGVSANAAGVSVQGSANAQ